MDDSGWQSTGRANETEPAPFGLRLHLRTGRTVEGPLPFDGAVRIIRVWAARPESVFPIEPTDELLTNRAAVRSFLSTVFERALGNPEAVFQIDDGTAESWAIPVGSVEALSIRDPLGTPTEKPMQPIGFGPPTR